MDNKTVLVQGESYELQPERRACGCSCMGCHFHNGKTKWGSVCRSTEAAAYCSEDKILIKGGE